MKTSTALLVCLGHGLVLVGGCTSTPTEEPALPTVELEVSLVNGEAWIDLEAGEVLSEAPADPASWDLRISGWNLFLNGGASGPGDAAGIPFRDLDPDLQFEEVNREQDLLYFLFQDDYGSSLSAWWAYGLRSDHNLYSRFHRYWVGEPEQFWLVQILGYYELVEGAPEAGWVTFRWREVGPEFLGPTQELVVDATAGGFGVPAEHPDNHFSYVDLAAGEVLSHDDASAASALDWHIGFRRFYVRLNGGTSGTRGIAAYDHDALRPESSDSLLALSASSELEEFEGLTWEDRPASGDLEEDQVTPILAGWVEGTPGVNATAATIPFLVSTADDSVRAKLRVVSLEDGTPSAPESLTLEYALLP